MYEFFKERQHRQLPNSRSVHNVECVDKFLKEIERRKLSSLRSAHYAECEYEFLKETQATRPTLGTQR